MNSMNPKVDGHVRCPKWKSSDTTRIIYLRHSDLGLIRFHQDWDHYAQRWTIVDR